jgi:hypothetical protein
MTNGKEVLLLVDALAREKNVPKDIVFTALEAALASATKKKYADNIDARVAIDRETGEYESFRRWTVVPDEEHEEPAHQIAITDAADRDPELELGDVVEEPLEPVGSAASARRPRSRSSCRRSGRGAPADTERFSRAPGQPAHQRGQAHRAWRRDRRVRGVSRASSRATI